MSIYDRDLLMEEVTSIFDTYDDSLYEEDVQEIQESIIRKIKNIIQRAKTENREEEEFLECVKKATSLFFENGSRSNKKVDTIHKFIKKILDKIIVNKNLEHIYSVRLEHKIPACNEAGEKRCDIVVMKNNVASIVFPVKFVMSNYKQNKNNFWECLTGETMHIKMASKNIKIIPINIIFNKVPYLSKNKLIQKYEEITIENSFAITEKLKNWDLCSEVINIIIDVSHECEIAKEYNCSPKILQVSKSTPYMLSKVVEKLIL